MIIKLFLVGSAIALCWWVLRGGRRSSTLAFTRAAGLGLAAGWIVAVLFPGVVTALAQSVGVGRGTDLVLYVGVVAFTFGSVLQRRRAHELEQRITVLTRSVALLEQQVDLRHPGEDRTAPVVP
ncbi:MAG: DUF2304 domain-containing protein [Nocardioides sp.]|nr:DUF2304 domain-containing protein [Nocardioides sp.]